MLSLFINLCWKARSFSLICDCWSCQALSSEKTVLAFMKTVRILRWQSEPDGIWCMKSSLRSPGWLSRLGGSKRGTHTFRGLSVSSVSSSWIKKLFMWNGRVGQRTSYRWGEGLGLLMPFTKELIVSSGQWLWTWIPDTSSLSQPCPRLMTSWELLIHFYSVLPTSSSFERNKGGSPPPSRPTLSRSPFEGVHWNNTAIRCQYGLRISTSLKSFWQKISIRSPQTLVCTRLSQRASLIPGESQA